MDNVLAPYICSDCSRVLGWSPGGGLTICSDCFTTPRRDSDELEMTSDLWEIIWADLPAEQEI